MRAHRRKIVAGAIVVIASQRVGAKRRPMTGSAKQSRQRTRTGFCFVASLLATTNASLRCNPRQMNGPPERLLHQIEGIDENAQAVQSAGPESREMGDPQVDRLV